jgi:hypothetical protein
MMKSIVWLLFFVLVICIAAEAEAGIFNWFRPKARCRGGSCSIEFKPTTKPKASAKDAPSPPR